VANELGYMHFAAGRTGVFRIRSLVDATQVWNNVTAAWETYATASITSYTITSTQQGTASRWYIGNFPATIVAGNYLVQFWDVASGNPATITESDILVGDYLLAWNGSGVVTSADIVPVDFTFSTVDQVDQSQCAEIYRGSGTPLRFTPVVEMPVDEDYWIAYIGTSETARITFSVALGNMDVDEATGITILYPTPAQTEAMSVDFPPRLEFWRTGPVTALGSNVALVAIVNVSIMDTIRGVPA
jgi:hypothetical protein